MHGSRAVSYTKKKRLANKETCWVTRRPRRTGRGRPWKSRQGGSSDHRKPFFPEIERADQGKEGLPLGQTICHLPFLSGPPCSEEKKDCLAGKGRVTYPTAGSMPHPSAGVCAESWGRFKCLSALRDCTMNSGDCRVPAPQTVLEET